MDAIATNLTTVRERLGKSQKEVAARLGVSPSLVSKWEKSERKPDEGQIWELARMFGVTASFLQDERPAVQFRPRSQVARNSDDKSGLGSALNDAAQQIHSLHEIWAMSDRTPQRLPLAMEFSDPMLPTLAATVRSLLRLNDKVTYAELREALTEQQVQVFEWKLPPKLSGLSFQRDFSVIFINETMPEKVKLFTLCHELAHLLFHLRGENETEVSVMASRNDPHEKEANHFAAELLMPAVKVDALVKAEGAKLQEKAGFFAAVERFGVSPGAMFYRLAQRPWEVVTYAKKAEFFTEIVRAPLEAPGARVTKVEEQLPLELLKLSAELWQAGKVSMGKVAEWCMAARSKMDMYLVTLADRDQPVDDIDLGYAEVDGMIA